MSDNKEFTLSCPLPIQQYPHVMLAHGGGGKLMNQLIDSLILPGLSEHSLQQSHDSSIIENTTPRLAFTTDSYVVQPLFFPGGDIGSLAVHGTVNDLAMAGAKPLYLSAAFILEEGLPMETLHRVIQSMKQAADQCGVSIITGDTKVVDRGKGDGMFINTAGIGIIEYEQPIHPHQIQEGDAILINGDLGRHGIAIMAVREGLQFDSEIESDSAPVADLVLKLLEDGIEIHCMRDLTRGGLASALNEITQASQYSIQIEERSIPVRDDVRGACEMLGFDPIYVANEGRFAAFVAEKDAERALAIMRAQEMGQQSALIGHVQAQGPARVTMKSLIGASRIIDMLSGEQLPRIC